MDPYPIAEHVKLAATFGIIGLGINILCALGGYFRLPSVPHRPSRLHFKHIITAFIIYIGIPFVIPQIVYNLINNAQASPLIQVTLFETLYFALAATFLFIFFISARRLRMKEVWIEGPYSTIPGDLLLGFFSYFIAIPLIISIGEFADIFNRLVFGVEGAEQLAVRYLKLVMDHPYLLLIALAVILICAPFLEEFVFRGLLQSWLREKVGVKAAILLSSLLFALFHFSPSQGIGNIPLILSLSVFALYLGFLYEKRRSLFAPIALHMTFNSISVIRIVFLTGGPS